MLTNTGTELSAELSYFVSDNGFITSQVAYISLYGVRADQRSRLVIANCALSIFFTPRLIIKHI